MTAQAVMAIQVAAALLKEEHEGDLHELACEFEAELADHKKKAAMSKIEIKFKAAFVKAHKAIDKVLKATPAGAVKSLVK